MNSLANSLANSLTNRDVQVGIAVILLAVLSLFVVIPAGVVMPGSIDVAVMAPDFWPALVSIIAGMAGGFVLAGGLMDARAGGAAKAEETEYRPHRQAALRVVIMVLSLLILYRAIEWIGIVAGSMVLLAFLIRFTGESRWRLIIAIAVGLPMLLYGFFVYVASVPMPLGIFEQFR